MASMKSPAKQLIWQQNNPCFHTSGHFMASTAQSSTYTIKKDNKVHPTLSRIRKPLKTYKPASCNWCNNNSKYHQLKGSSIRRSDSREEKLGHKLIAQRIAFWIRNESTKEKEDLYLHNTQVEKLCTKEHEERLTYLKEASSPTTKVSFRKAVDSLPSQTVVDRQTNSTITSLTKDTRTATSPLASNLTLLEQQLQYQHEKPLQALQKSVEMINGRIIPHGTDHLAYNRQFSIVLSARSGLEVGTEYETFADNFFTDHEIPDFEDEDEEFGWLMSAVHRGLLRLQGANENGSFGGEERNEVEQAIMGIDDDGVFIPGLVG